jgi:hypothetical protein
MRTHLPQQTSGLTSKLRPQRNSREERTGAGRMPRASCQVAGEADLRIPRYFFAFAFLAGFFAAFLVAFLAGFFAAMIRSPYRGPTETTRTKPHSSNNAVLSNDLSDRTDSTDVISPASFRPHRMPGGAKHLP